MKKNWSTIIFLSGIIFCSCQKGNNSPPSNTPVDVYVAGYEANNANNNVAKYWKNGAPYVLSDGLYPAVATSVYISGNDVYISGYESNAAGNNVAGYWENGTKVILGDGTINTTAWSIVVSNNDVYVAGASYDSSVGISKAIYWKNGTPFYLDSASNYGGAYRIAVSGTDVYVAGNDDYGNAVYWKNGNIMILQGNALVRSMVISGNDVYITGIVLPPTGVRAKVKARIWINGSVPTYLSDNANATYGEGIAISGNDIYVAGISVDGTGNHPVYWKNDSINNLPSNGTVPGSICLGAACAISAFGNDIYIAGEDGSATNKIAAYWKNGKLVDLTDGSHNAESLAIFISKQ